MPPLSKFEGEQQRRRWASYLGQYVGEGKITPTALNARLGGSHAVSRVSRWLRGERGVGEDTAWEVGHALRGLGADTNEIEALWAGGFFAAIFRLLQWIASEGDPGTQSAVRLFSLLPARMLSFETKLCEDVAENVEHGIQYLKMYHTLAAGGYPYTEERGYENPEDWREGRSYSPTERFVQRLVPDVYSSERFRVYQRAWERVCRGDRPAAALRTNDSFRGDDDLIDVLCDAAGRMKERWVPSLLCVRLWRIALEWADELAPVEKGTGYSPSCADFVLIPDLFLLAAMVVLRKDEVEADKRSYP